MSAGAAVEGLCCRRTRLPLARSGEVRYTHFMPVLAPLGFALTLTHPSIFSQPPLIPKLTRNTQSWPPSPRPLWHYLCPAPQHTLQRGCPFLHPCLLGVRGRSCLVHRHHLLVRSLGAVTTWICGVELGVCRMVASLSLPKQLGCCRSCPSRGRRVSFMVRCLFDGLCGRGDTSAVWNSPLAAQPC